MDDKHRERLRAKLLRHMAKARDKLEGTRREDYATSVRFAMVVSRRLHAVRRIKRELRELDE